MAVVRRLAPAFPIEEQGPPSKRERPAELPVRPELVPVSDQAWDRLEEEPNFQIIIDCQRADDGLMPHNNINYGYTREGLLRAPLSVPQRLYMAAVLRYVAELFHSREMPDKNIFSEIDDRTLNKMLRAEANAALNAWLSTVSELVGRRGVDYAARLTGMSKRQVRRIRGGYVPKPIEAVETMRLTVG